MITRCDGELGWPTEDPPSEREQIVAQLEELREETAPSWSVRRGIWNFAILIAKGLVRP